MKLKYCKECLWSIVATDPYDRLRCSHPNVNAKDAWELAAINIKGKACTEERGNTGWFGVACGIKGKLFEEIGPFIECNPLHSALVSKLLES